MTEIRWYPSWTANRLHAVDDAAESTVTMGTMEHKALCGALVYEEPVTEYMRQAMAKKEIQKCALCLRRLAKA